MEAGANGVRGDHPTIMRTEQSYIAEYGKKAGMIIFKLLQKEAAHARWKEHYREKLKECRKQVKRLEVN
jgi:hypothetical protein